MPDDASAYNIHNYRSIPPLADYIDRIGADQLNFRRFMVRVWRGNYYNEKVLVTLDAEGSITVNNKEYAPTTDEATAIKAAFRVVSFPSCVGASESALERLYEQLGSKEGVFGFWCQRTSLYVMAQQRIEHENGAKRYMPWTFWSDSVWRQMEPEGKLPFWKPKERISELIMIHEGAKAGAYAHWLCYTEEGKATREKHPWAEELCFYEHWGMIGGALAPHRSDYEELHYRRPVDVVYFCDNDPPGKAALQEVSRNYGRSMKGIKLDGHWPYSWDIADEMPEKLFTRKGRYIGKPLRGFMEPATFATDVVQTGQRGRPTYIIKKEFREEWRHCVRPEVYLHKDWPDQMFSSTEFNNKVKPYSNVDDTARLLRSDGVGKGDVLCYRPHEAPGMSGGEGKRLINTHVGSFIHEEDGDVTPWLEFMEHLIPVESDRTELLKWCATLIAKPEEKMHYGVLLVSEQQGVGKTTLGEKVLTPLLGIENVSNPSENEIVESQFNAWCAHKRLAVINEIYAGHSGKAYNRLKGYATDRDILVNRKFMTPYQIENWLHIMACSNSPRALLLSNDDRRWLIPQVTEKKRSVQYWSDLNDWLLYEGGLEKIKGWAIRFVRAGNYVKTGDAAPVTEAKKDMILESFSPGMVVIHNTLRSLQDSGSDFAISDRALLDKVRATLYENRHNERLERPLAARKVAKQLGLFVGKERIWDGLSLVKIISNQESYTNGAFDVSHSRGDYIKTLTELDARLNINV